VVVGVVVGAVLDVPDDDDDICDEMPDIVVVDEARLEGPDVGITNVVVDETIVDDTTLDCEAVVDENEFDDEDTDVDAVDEVDAFAHRLTGENWQLESNHKHPGVLVHGVWVLRSEQLSL
jgi:hypothetical protein